MVFVVAHVWYWTFAAVVVAFLLMRSSDCDVPLIRASVSIVCYSVFTHHLILCFRDTGYNWPCNDSIPCADQNSACIDSHCLCPFGYSYSSLMDRCLEGTFYVSCT